MVKLSGKFSKLRPIKTLLLGDYMLDRYTRGKVERVSPEAPVAILHAQKEESRPGGAGNVALNFVALGAKVVCVGRIGEDGAGRELKGHLQEDGVDVSSLFFQEKYPTPVKNRFIAESQQLLRVDFENANLPLSLELEKKILQKLTPLLNEIDAIAISDYGKGFLTPSLLREVIEKAFQKKIPVIVDPKGHDFSKYRRATVLKPNLQEAYRAAKVSLQEPLEAVAKILLRESQVEHLLITRSEKGISLFDKMGSRFDFSVTSQEVKDVTGAGDVVLSMITVALGCGLNIASAAQMANIAAGIAIGHVGCKAVSLADLARVLLEVDAENKIFEESHLYVLREALKGKSFSLLALDGKRGMTKAVFQAIHTLSKKRELVVYVKEAFFDEEFLSILSSLKEVHFVILHSDTLKGFSDFLQPTEIFEIEGEKLCSCESFSLALPSTE